ncbi:MAG: hypothetical protein HC768_18620 [Acaryochloris sp. CRU_2_0]|nr:hypothetical protein [Acaryochloris sp. CRU_2_0]
MSHTELDVFAGGDELAEFVEDTKPWEQERPIDNVSIEVKAKRKTLPTHMSSKLQLVLIAIAATSIILFVLWLLGFLRGIHRLRIQRTKRLRCSS